MHAAGIELTDDAHHAPRRGAQQVIAQPQAGLRSEVRERIQDHHPLDALRVTERITERERSTEGFTEQRDRAAGRGAFDLAIEILDEILHAQGVVAVPGRGDLELPFERRNLPVEQQPGAVDAGDEDKVILHFIGNRQLSTVNSFYGNLPRVTPAQAGRVLWTVLSIFVVETIVFGLSVLPAFAFWSW